MHAMPCHRCGVMYAQLALSDRWSVVLLLWSLLFMCRVHPIEYFTPSCNNCKCVPSECPPGSIKMEEQGECVCAASQDTSEHYQSACTGAHCFRSRVAVPAGNGAGGAGGSPGMRPRGRNPNAYKYVDWVRQMRARCSVLVLVIALAQVAGLTSSLVVPWHDTPVS